MVTAIHFTSNEGVAAIEASGELRAGSFVTIPSEVEGLTAREAEKALEISAGKGERFTTFQTPRSNLGQAFNGPTTSGGIPQWQLNYSVPIGPNSFIITGY